MKDDVVPPSYGYVTTTYDSVSFARFARDLERFLTVLRSKGPVTVSDLAADSIVSVDGDFTDLQVVDLTVTGTATGIPLSGDGSAITDLNASELTTGTVPDARFPATLPAVSGANLTNLNANNLTSGTVPDARFPATLPAISGANLTNLDASDLASGTVPDARFPATLPAISGANLTNLDASDLASGTVPDARFPATLPAVSGANLTNLNASALASGTVSDSRLPTTMDGKTLTTATITAPTITNGSSKWFRGLIHGLELSNGTDATNDIDIAAGVAGSNDTTPTLMDLSSGITKQLDASWTVGTNQGGLDTGSIADTTYHVFLIKRSDTGVVDALFSASPTSPTMPTNYDLKRRIGSIVRSGATILGFVQDGERFLYDTPVTDRDSTSDYSAAVLAVTVPTGIRIRPILRLQARITNGPSSGQIFNTLADGDSTEVTNYVTRVVTTSGADSQDAAIVDAFFTDTSAQVYFSATQTGADSNILNTLGWWDTRGRDE